MTFNRFLSRKWFRSTRRVAATADLTPPRNPKRRVHLVQVFISRLQLGKTHRCYFRSVFLSSYALLSVRSLTSLCHRKIYDRPELHTLDFSLNRSISRCAQTLDKSRRREPVKTRGMLLCGACVSNSSLNQSVQLHSCWRHCASHADVPSDPQLQRPWLEGAVHEEADPKTTGFCTEALIWASQVTQAALSHAAKEDSISRTDRTLTFVWKRNTRNDWLSPELVPVDHLSSSCWQKQV